MSLGVKIMINRKEYLDELIRWKNQDLIKVVTGIRRCGKSTLFELFIDYLKKEGIKPSNIITIIINNTRFSNNRSRTISSNIFY